MSSEPMIPDVHTEKPAFLKCRFCRAHKKKCLPDERTWPTKCLRCIEKGLECSEPQELKLGRKSHRELQVLRGSTQFDVPDESLHRLLVHPQEEHTLSRQSIENSQANFHCDGGRPTSGLAKRTKRRSEQHLFPRRLLNCERLHRTTCVHKFSLNEFDPHDVMPEYAVLSHRWGEDEVNMMDLQNGTAESKTGYRKLRFCADQAARDGLMYFWVDTCCIDKANLDEMSQAVNSMHTWYRNAAKCYVYLTDVSALHDWESAFLRSDWFRRGWTLQELIAPSVVEFFSREGMYLGDKKSLEQQLHQITGISVGALQGKPSLRSPEDLVSTLLSWMSEHGRHEFFQDGRGLISDLQRHEYRRISAAIDSASLNNVVGPLATGNPGARTVAGNYRPRTAPIEPDEQVLHHRQTQFIFDNPNVQPPSRCKSRTKISCPESWLCKHPPFKSESEFRKHYMGDHEKPTEYFCKHCSFNTYRPEQFKRHHYQFHGECKQEISCARVEERPTQGPRKCFHENCFEVYESVVDLLTCWINHCSG